MKQFETLYLIITKLNFMTKKETRLVPLNENVEGLLSDSQAKMNADILKLFSTGFSQPGKSKLTKAQKELFACFQQEQQRINGLLEIQYLRKYLSDQRVTANTMAKYIKKRDAIEIKNYGELPISITSTNSVHFYSGASISKFKTTNDLKDLRKKVGLLDKLLRDLRSIVTKYEIEDFKRKDELNGGGLFARLTRYTKKKLRKAA